MVMSDGLRVQIGFVLLSSSSSILDSLTFLVFGLLLLVFILSSSSTSSILAFFSSSSSVLLGVLIWNFLLGLLQDVEVDGVGDELGVLLDDFLDLGLVQVVSLLILEV